ncbi:MAG: exodeoxyribonuclease III [Caulobacteraceae bacterium]
MRLRIASWNVNSIRLRVNQIARFVEETGADVLCLQEIKCQEAEFPAEDLARAGLPHIKIRGQKGWHGVAIASRLPIEAAPELTLCRERHARCVSGTIGGIEIQNFYVPAGGEIPDRDANRKFDHKLDFLERLTAEMARRDRAAPLVVTGDLNVAPGEHDVWNHRFMSKVVSHTPTEVRALEALKASLDFTDLIREARPEPEKIFSWWSYRADFRISNRGLRLDHIWASPALRPSTREGGARIHADVRAWDRPSDHAPVSADLIL